MAANRNAKSDAADKRTRIGVVWSFAERFSSQAIGFVVILVMARLLSPADYGLVGMLTIFIELGGSLADSGFSQALIRRRDRTKTDTSTVFYFNVAVGLFLYGVLWILAPHIARYYDEPILTPLTRAISLLLPINALSVVPRALLSANLNFRSQTLASIVAYLLSGSAGIYLAYSGYGVWAIVGYQLMSQMLYCVMLWIGGRWWPSLSFSLKSFAEMFGFGSRLAVSGIIDIIYRNSFLLVIGKVYKAADLGYFTRAQQIGGFLSANVSGVVQRVAYPAMCDLQHDKELLRERFLKFSIGVSLIVFPLMWVLISLASPVVEILLGEKWAYAATLLPPLALSFMWHPVQSLNLQVLQVCGRSDLFLRIEILKKIFGVAFLAVAVPFGMKAICWSMVAGSAVSYVINSWYSARLVDAGIKKQLHLLGPIFVMSGLSSLAAWISTVKIEGAWLQLMVGLGVFCLIYLPWYKHRIHRAKSTG